MPRTAPFLRALSTVLLLGPVAVAAQQPDDPFLWLEDVEGERALEWVIERNERTLDELSAHPAFEPIRERVLGILDSDDRIAFPSILGDDLYNFWQDGEHPRGIWRRTSWDAYLAGDPAWEIVLDIDALAAEEDVNWSYGGATCLRPEYRRCLVRLSRGGADAVEIREFDARELRFLEDGFFLPEAKQNVAWLDEDRLLVSTDFGEGSLTTSGYARIAKLWERGIPLARAETLFEGEVDDVLVSVASFQTADRTYGAVIHRPGFFEGTTRILLDGELVLLDLPLDATPSLVGDRLVVRTRSPWAVGGETLPAGALVATDLEDFLGGERSFETIFEPSERTVLRGVTATRGHLLVSLLDDVRTELRRYTYRDGTWEHERIPAPELASASFAATSPTTDRFFVTYSGYTRPTTLLVADEHGSLREVRSMPEMFDASGLVVEQHHATSRDGTRVPYFLVRHEDLVLDGSNPTLLYGYGGFEISLTPDVLAHRRGRGWLARAAYTWSRTSAAAASSGRSGTARRCARTASAHTTTSSPSPRSCRSRITCRRSSGSPAAATAGCSSGPRPRAGRSCSVPWSAWCRCWTCAATTGCWPARAGWPSTAIRTTPTTGPSSRVLAVPQPARRGALSPDPAHHHHAGRPGPSGSRPEDGGPHGGHGLSGLLLREHRGRARRRGDERAASGHDRRHLRLSLAGAGQAGGPGHGRGWRGEVKRGRPRPRRGLLVVPAVWVAVALPACDAPEPPSPNASEAGERPLAERLAEARLVDLTHPLNDQTLVWPTSIPFEFETTFEGHTDDGYFYASRDFAGPEHGGTHLDAPIHFFEGRWTTDQIPLDRLVGPAVVVDVSRAAAADPNHQVGVDELTAWEEAHGRIPDGAIVLLFTDRSRLWADAEAYMGTAERGEAAVADLEFPGLHPDAARWIVENRDVAGVGIDTPSLDHGPSTLFETHRILFEANIYGLENVANLGALPPTGATVLAFPLRLEGGTGGPVRIVAVVE
jgi:prolyl oligopeptidase